jgi:hypothetical protein
VRLTLVDGSYQKINGSDFIFIFTELGSKFSGGGGGNTYKIFNFEGLTQ